MRATRYKRRTMRILKKGAVRETKNPALSFQETLALLDRDLSFLFEKKRSPHDPRLIQRIALNLKHLYVEALKLKRFPKYKERAERILLSLTTPWGAPFVIKTTLLEAAASYGEQDPLHSDLHLWLKEISRYGHHFSGQILSMLHD